MERNPKRIAIFAPMNFQLHTLPKLLKSCLIAFLIALSFGYFSGIDLLKHTTDFKSKGIENNVLGNELDESAETLHFKMSERELHGIIHSHVVSLSVLFLILGVLIYFTSLPTSLRAFLMLEPMLSLLATFGGLWLLWSGVVWLKYLIMISGVLMHLSFVVLILCLLRELLLKKD